MNTSTESQNIELTSEEVELIELLREHGEPAFILLADLMKQEARRLGLAQSDH